MVSVLHPGLVVVIVVVLGIPAVTWIARRVSRALARYDARMVQLELALVTASLEPADMETDSLSLIESLAQDEIALIREIVDARVAGAHASPEHCAQLRRAHRRGLAARQRCGDPALDAELGWLQHYGLLALTTDLAELDRQAFERDLNHRATEVHRAIALRRSRVPHD